VEQPLRAQLPVSHLESQPLLSHPQDLLHLLQGKIPLKLKFKLAPIWSNNGLRHCGLQQVERVVQPVVQAGLLSQPQAGLFSQPQVARLLLRHPQSVLASQPQVGAFSQPQAGFFSRPQAGLASQPQAELEVVALPKTASLNRIITPTGVTSYCFPCLLARTDFDSACTMPTETMTMNIAAIDNDESLMFFIPEKLYSPGICPTTETTHRIAMSGSTRTFQSSVTIGKTGSFCEIRKVIPNLPFTQPEKTG
jgi:hypothetical protein